MASFSVQIMLAGDSAPANMTAETAAPGPFAPLSLTRHARRPLRLEGVEILRVGTRDDEDALFWHEIALILTHDRAVALWIRGVRRLENDADGALRRRDHALLATDAESLRAALEEYDPAALAIPTGVLWTDAQPSAIEPDEGEDPWSLYLEEVDAIRADFARARARLLDARAD